jgi:hypothetical protein
MLVLGDPDLPSRSSEAPRRYLIVTMCMIPMFSFTPAALITSTMNLGSKALSFAVSDVSGVSSSTMKMHPLVSSCL